MVGFANRRHRTLVKSITWRGNRFWIAACTGCLEDKWFPDWGQAQHWASGAGQSCRCAQRVGLWTTRTTSSGRFEAVKRSGDVLGGARRED